MATIRRYNGSNRRRVYPSANLIDVELPSLDPAVVDKAQHLKSDEILAPGEYCPGYAVKSVCDKSYYNPASGMTSPIAAAPRVPLYDTQNGQKPNISLNLGWLRSKARDVVEVDNALKVLERVIEQEKTIDMNKVNELETKRADLDNLKTAISKGISSSDTPDTSK